MPAEVRNGRRRRDQPAKSPMRCRSLRQVFCSFTTSFPRCSVARFPAATLGTFTAEYLPPFPLPQPPLFDQPTKQTCLYQSLFIPIVSLTLVYTCSNLAHLHTSPCDPHPVLSTTLFSIFLSFPRWCVFVVLLPPLFFPPPSPRRLRYLLVCGYTG